MTTVPRRLPLVLAIAQLFVLRAGGEQFKGRIEVHAIEITAVVRDADGRVPRDLVPADFVVLENGVAQTIIGLEYADTPQPASRKVTPTDRHVVIFMQQSLSSTEGLRRAVTSLASEAENIVAAGEVVVVTDDPRPHALFGPTHDAGALRDFLVKLGGEITGKEELMRIRAAFADNDRPPNASNEAEAGAERIARDDQIRMRARQEATALRMREDALLSWMSDYASRTSGSLRTLLLVSDGFDLDPASFYRSAAVRALSAVPHHEEIAHALAAEHWTVISLAMMPPPHAVTPSEFSSRIGEPIEATVTKAEKRAVPLNGSPLAALARLADATGGGVVTDAKNIGTQLREMSDRVVITYQSSAPADGTVRRVEITSKRLGVTIRAQRWAGPATAGAIVEAMAASFATEVATTEEDAPRGELPVTCSISLGPVVRGIRNSELRAHVDLKPVEDMTATDEPGALDFSVAVVSPKEQPFTITRRMKDVDLASAGGYTCTIGIRHRQNARIAVIASEPSTGSWGTCTVDGASR